MDIYIPIENSNYLSHVRKEVAPFIQGVAPFIVDIYIFLR